MERRHVKRYGLELPLTLVRAGKNSLSAGCLTKNISSRGVLFYIMEAMPDTGVIEYSITFPGDGTDKSVELHCLGHVLRRDLVPGGRPESNGNCYQVAVSMERHKMIRQEI